jgi:hypothetical protein
VRRRKAQLKIQKALLQIQGSCYHDISLDFFASPSICVSGARILVKTPDLRSGVLTFLNGFYVSNLKKFYRKCEDY